jgi:hypothetical protein
LSRHLPTRPDPMPLREALRGLRFMLRRGGETLAETVAIDSFPKPAAELADVIIREVGGFARNVDELASDLAKRALGGHASQAVALDHFGAEDTANAQFAAAVYVALRSVLRRLGAPGVFVSEAAARQAWDVSSKIDAASLTVNLLNARVVRGATAKDAALVPGSALEPVVIFAVLLWLQSSRSDEENEAALDAATDLAVALAPDVAKACAARDVARIEALYASYVAHV